MRVSKGQVKQMAEILGSLSVAWFTAGIIAPFFITTSFETWFHTTHLISLDENKAIIEVPNRESWQSRLTKNNWFHLDVPRHVSHFNPKSIAVLLNLSGFSVLKINHFSFIYGIFGFTQSILNLFTKRKNLLFDFLNGKIKTSASGKHRASMRDAFVTGVLLPPALPREIHLI